MRNLRLGTWALAATLVCQGICWGSDVAEPVGEPVLELPTVRCLGVSWVVRGDANHKASVEVQYREVGQEPWRQGAPLWRVDQSPQKLSTGAPARKVLAQLERQGGFVHAGKIVEIPPDGELFSGSIVMLKPDTAYQIKLTLKNPDGVQGDAIKTLESRTAGEPIDPSGGPVFHVAPGNGGGTGAKDSPYLGLEVAEAAAKPGDTFLLHGGKYQGTWEVKHSGEPDKPIVWRGAGDGEAIIDSLVPDAQQKAASADLGTEIMTNFAPEQRAHWLAPRGISAEGVHDVWFENLTVRNAQFGIVIHDSARIVIRRCHIDEVWCGIMATKNTEGRMGGLFISDNVVEGSTSWPRAPRKAPDDCGIWVNGVDDVICYNYVHNFGDGIQTFRGDYVEDIDVYNNDMRQCTDDGLELKDTYRNVRVFENRVTNGVHPISVAPVLGGPEYIFRNVLYNMESEPFKIHNSPSGVLFYNNTIVEDEDTLGIWTPAPVYNCVMRNNLLVANKISKASSQEIFHCDPKMVDCDFDYWGFAVGDFESFLKWNDQHYKTLADAQKAGLFRHSLMLKSAGLFASGAAIPKDFKDAYEPPDLRLAPNSPAVGAGEALPGFTEPGKPVDLGAYPLGGELPHYGPRPEK